MRSSPMTDQTARGTCSSGSSSAPSTPVPARSPASIPRTSTPSRGRWSRPSRAGWRRSHRAAPALDRALERHLHGPARQQDLLGAGRPHRDLPVAGHAHGGRLQPLLARAGRRTRRRPRLLPGPLLAGQLRSRLSGRPALRSAARRLPAGGVGGGRAQLLPAPVADARVLAVPDGVAGHRGDHLDLSGALHEVPGGARDGRHLPAQGVDLPRRRRDGRARVDGRHRPGGPRAAGQPHLGGQLQPPAPRRAGARQRQDHPGAGVRLPRRRLERHQGHLGHAVGPAAGGRRRRRAGQGDGGLRRRGLPDLQVTRRRLRARALLRTRPTSAQARRAHVRRRDLAAQPRRARPAEGLRGLRRRRPAHRPADGHPGQDDQGLRHGGLGRGPDDHPPGQEDDRGRAPRLP